MQEDIGQEELGLENTAQEKALLEETPSPIQRAEYHVRRRFPELSRSVTRYLFQHHLLRRHDGTTLKKGDPCKVDDIQWTLTELREALQPVSGKTLPVPVVWEDSDIWVVDKPSGIAPHPLRPKINGEGMPHLTEWAFQHDPTVAAHFPGLCPILTPHRLDILTSGLQIVCRNAQSYVLWRERFHQHEIVKTYHAWCEGLPTAESWTIDAPLFPSRRYGKMTTDPDEARVAKSWAASSDVRVLDRQLETNRCFCEITTQTGVTHQVRVHMAASGFPLCGDPLYGANAVQSDTRFFMLKAVKLVYQDWIVTLPSPL